MAEHDDEIAFLFIGGPHQVFHLAPVAAELAGKLPDATISCIYPDRETGAALREVKRACRASEMRLTHVPPPRWAESLAHAAGHRSLRKGPLLLRLARRVRHARAVITPERTSAALRLMGLRDTPLIHFRHGAGDRAPRSERRLNAFDLIVEPGIKDVHRAVAEQHIDPARLRCCGYVKLDFLSRRAARPTRLFDNGRPVVVYNPHFDTATSSWPAARQVIEAFRQQDHYNLIFAPHIRLSEDMGGKEIAAWQALAEPGRILVDLKSERLIDMTYTMAADIYLGDMSSQLYEFLIRPRPAVFLNTRHVAWERNPRYAGWKLGEVADDPAEVIDAVTRARVRHPEMVKSQRAAIQEAYGYYKGASERAAQIIVEALALAESRPRGRDLAGAAEESAWARKKSLAKGETAFIDNDSQ